MKNQTTAIFIACLFALSAQAQKLTMKWGPEFELERGEQGLVGKTKDAFYTLQIEDKELFLSKFRNADMSKIFKKNIKSADIPRKGADDKVSFLKLVQLKNNFLMLFLDEDKKNDQEYIYAQVFDFNGNTQGGVKELSNRKTYRRSKDGAFSFEVSDDSTKLLVVEYPPYEKYNNQEFKFKAFDSKLNVLYNFGTTFPYKDKDFGLKDFDITNEGMILILARIDIPSKEKKKGEENYYYQLVSINTNNKNEVKQYDINLDRKYIIEARLLLDKANDLKCVGVYADMKDNGRAKSGINGTFFVGIDKKTGKVMSSSTKDFSSKLVEELSGKKRAKKDKGLENTYDIKQVLAKEDGGTVVIMEDNWVDAVTTCSSSGTGGRSCVTNYYYHNDELLIINIDPKGQISNYITIPKEQVTVNDGGIFNSIYATRYNGKTILLLNDSKQNTGTDFKYAFTKSKKDGIYALVVSDNGQYTRMPLMIEGLKKKEFFLICPKDVDRVSDNEAVLYGHKMKAKCCFGGGKTKTRYGYLSIQ